MRLLGGDEKGHKFIGVALTVAASAAILIVLIVFSALVVDDILPTTTTTTTTTTTVTTTAQPTTTTTTVTTTTTTAATISAEGSFRVTSDDFSEILLNKDSDEYKAMETKYTNIVISLRTI